MNFSERKTSPVRSCADVVNCGGCSSSWTRLKPTKCFSLTDSIKRFCLRNSGRGIVVLLSDLMDKRDMSQPCECCSQQMDIFVLQILIPKK